MKKVFIAALTIWFTPFTLCQEGLLIETLYGSAVIHEPVLIDLINSKAMQRLKKINQYGIEYFVHPTRVYTRYQHSIGVLFLLRHFGASLEEQVFGLLHDVSHTVFSHVADYLFDSVLDKYSYQDTIFDWYIEHTDLLPILQKHMMTCICSPEARERYVMVKDDLPSLCIDRLEYNLYGAYIEGLLTQEEVQQIISNLDYENNQWIFNDCASASTLAYIPMNFSKEVWCAPWNCFIYAEAAALLKRGIDINLITLDDLIFSTDDHVWDLFNSSSDVMIQCHIHRIMNYATSFKIGSSKLYDFHTKGKFRGIDPLVRTKDGIVCLSACDVVFKEEYSIACHMCTQELYIQYA